MKEKYSSDEIKEIELGRNNSKYLFEEIERQKEIIRQLDIKNLELTTIIKEVREIFKDYGEKEDIVGYTMYNITGEMLLKLLEILDKEVN